MQAANGLRSVSSPTAAASMAGGNLSGKVANLDAARKIGNEIMMNTQQNTQSNSKYTCMPMTNGQAYYSTNGGQYDYQQSQQQQHQQPNRPYPSGMMSNQAQHQQQMYSSQQTNNSYQHHHHQQHQQQQHQQQVYSNQQHYQMQRQHQQQLNSPTGSLAHHHHQQQQQHPNLMRSTSSNNAGLISNQSNPNMPAYNQMNSMGHQNMNQNNSTSHAMYPNSMPANASINKSQQHHQTMYFNNNNSNNGANGSNGSPVYNAPTNWNHSNNSEFYHNNSNNGRLPASNGANTPMANGPTHGHYQNSVHPLSGSANNNNNFQSNVTGANTANPVPSNNSNSYYNSNTFDFSPSSSSCSSVSSNSSSSSSSSSSSLNTSANMNLNNNKSSPLDNLERLVLLPETIMADSAKTVSNNEQSSSEPNGYESTNHHSANSTFYDHGNEVPTPSTPISNSSNKNSNKRNLNDMSPIGNSSKKRCNPMSLNYGGQDYNNRMQQQQQQQQQRTFSPPNKQQMPPIPVQQQTSLLPDDPTAFDDDSALIASLNVNLNEQASTNANQSSDVTSANIIDASNFDFLDYLPELNSTTIDQTITTATAESTSSSGNAQPAGHLELNSPESIDNLFKPNMYTAGSNFNGGQANYNHASASTTNNYSNPNNNMIYSYQ